MATSKSGGSTSLGRDSRPKYLGIKIQEGQKAKPGMIIVKQRGTKIRPGKNVKRGGDDTLFALKSGVVSFRTKKVELFDGSRRLAKFVDIK